MLDRKILTEIIADAPVPMYRQLANLIRDRIECGELVRGARIPSEVELGNTYKISRITVRQALSELEWEGFLERAPGKGTFVRRSAGRLERMTRLTGFGENMAGLGRKAGYATLRAGEETVPLEVVARLRLPEVRAFVVDRVLLTDGRPVGAHLSYLPLWIINGAPTGSLSREALDSSSLYGTIEESGVVLSRAEEIVEPALAGPEDAKKLDIAEGGLVLRVTRTVYDAEEHPLEYVLITYRSDVYTFRQQLYRKDLRTAP